VDGISWLDRAQQWKIQMSSGEKAKIFTIWQACCKMNFLIDPLGRGGEKIFRSGRQ
jgi:hypothetical protein